MNIILPIIIVSGIGLLAGLILSISSLLMAVKVDDKKESIKAVLPGANCGACGYAGCDSYAEALSKGGVETTLCPVGGTSVAAQIAEILGVQKGTIIEKTAVVRCAGNWDNTKNKYDYEGLQTCSGTNQMFSGQGDCAYGCLGFGECKELCEYGAIEVKNGLAVVNPELCKACGKCIKACPKGLIYFAPKNNVAHVSCSNREKGALTRKICAVGCIGCKLCEKVCESEAITIKDFLAKVDTKKCTNCGKCITACPQKCIH